MIDFSCPQCEALFAVPDNLAGRKGKCKGCGAALIIPHPETAAAPAEAPKIPMRIRRLRADAEQMSRVFQKFPYIKVRAMQGDPPDVYELEFNVKGLERVNGKKDPIQREHHIAEIRLGPDYPRLGPKCKMITPVFHPNIEPATICVGDYWTAGERLVDLTVRIGELIAYQAYNIKSPLDGEAAMWADLHGRELPIDNRNLRPPEMD